MNSSSTTHSLAQSSRPDTVGIEEVLPLIATVDSHSAGMLRSSPATAHFERLPFYDAAGLLRAMVLGPRPVMFRYVYIPDARRVYRVGAPELVRDANAAARLRLRSDVVIAYLRYYLEATGNESWWGRRLAVTAADVPWLPATETDSTEREERARLTERIHPAVVTSGPDGGFRVTSTTIRGQAIEVVTFEITAAGEVTISDVTSLTDEAPVVQVL